MVGQEVLPSVPSVSIISRQAASKLNGGAALKLVGVQQSFEGPSKARHLIFPETKVLNSSARSLVINTPRRYYRSRT
jgi:hypothetical protein